MRKDNFDLRGYLVENKMTENSRGDVRHKLGETNLDIRVFDPEKATLLEMKIPADPDALMEGDPYDHHDPDYDENYFSGEGADRADAYNDAQKDAGIDECGDVDMTGNIPLDEAGYTDDEDDDYSPDDLDLDDRGGASLMDLIGKRDKNARKARKAAAKDTAEDPAMDDDPVATDAPVDPTDPEEDPEAAAAGEADPNAEAQTGLSSQVKYNPSTVEMMMNTEELNQYLSGFRRPQVAVNVLNRAIRAAQDEVNDSIGISEKGCLYIVLGNGFYHTSRMADRYKEDGSWYEGETIAKVKPDMVWRKKNFGD